MANDNLETKLPCFGDTSSGCAENVIVCETETIQTVTALIVIKLLRHLSDVSPVL